MQRVNRYKVVPVVVINDLSETKPLMEALITGGLPIAEITYRTPFAKDAIALTAKEYPEVLVGAGTIINKEQCKEAISMGAKFIVGPGFQADVSKVCKKEGIPYFPGCVTPTEIIEAVNDGWTTVKFFPAQVYGGLAAMKALSGPFPQVKFIPTGGVDASNLAEYLAWDKLDAIGGSWMMKGSHDDIIAKCKEISEIVKSVN